MKFDRLVALLPCQSLEDFDLGRGEEEAEQLLSAWSSLWHPALLASAESLPSWLPAESPPPDPARHLVIVPDCCLPLVPADWLSQAEAGGACVLRNLPSRQQMVAAALERLAPEEAADVCSPAFRRNAAEEPPKGGTTNDSLPAAGGICPDLAADFLRWAIAICKSSC